MRHVATTETTRPRPALAPASRPLPHAPERRGAVLVARGTWLPTEEGLADLMAAWDPDAARAVNPA
jgi:hypothetical protein